MEFVGRARVLVLLAGAAIVGCHSSGSHSSSATTASGGSSGGGGSGGGETTIDITGDAGVVTVQTSLPPLPELVNVVPTVIGDGVTVTFDPFEAAADYRIYPLPANTDIVPQSNGAIIIKNATYRCAGAREDLYMLVDTPGSNDTAAGGTTIANGAVDGYTRSEADSTLGYVYVTPGTGRLPVYVLASGDSKVMGCGRVEFKSSRPNSYTTDASTRTQLLAAKARDDGVAFYVPDAPGPNTRSVYEGTVNGDVLRWIDGPEGAARTAANTTIFNVLTAADADTAPLRRLFVSPYCMPGHDELVAGAARYSEVKVQGDQPMPAVHWSGIAGDTTFVVEALDSMCPFQGQLSPEHQDALANTSGPPLPAFLTLDDLRNASASGEVFVNGQADSSTFPKAIARSFVTASPRSAAAMDFYDDFQSPLDPFVDQNDEMWVDKHLANSQYDFSTYSNESFHFGTFLGELWFAFADVAADTPGKVRLTPLQKAQLSSDSYLQVTTSVDFVSTDRRYPQILITDQDVPIQDHLPSGTTLVVQLRNYSPTYFQVEVCDHRTWDVNNQCPLLPTFSSAFAPPGQMPAESVGLDLPVKIDIYVSTQRLYLFLADQPYSCTNFPATAADSHSYNVPHGAVTVTLGDVLYHSGVDLSIGGNNITHPGAYMFHRNHMHFMTRRQFDNFGFKSGVEAPPWDESRFPCVSQ